MLNREINTVLISRPRWKLIALLLGACFLIQRPVLSQDLGHGFYDHGAACPVSNHRGAVATVDGNGRNVLLAWLYDHRGGYGLLMIDAATGKSEQFPLPFAIGDAPYASLLSSRNKFYTYFNNYFVEFDPIQRGFSFYSEAKFQNAMSFTEDDKGVIWAASFPNSGLVSYDPATKTFTDHGYLYKQNWRMYPKYIAADDAGWIYFGIGNTSSQIIGFDPVTKTTKIMLEEGERERGLAYVYRNKNGKVYGSSLKDSKDKWFEFYKGQKTKIGVHNDFKPLAYKAGQNEYFYGNFPDGGEVTKFDMHERKLEVRTPAGANHTVSFTYTSDGAHVTGVATAPNGMITGGTAFPMRQFFFDPSKQVLKHIPAFGQLNTMTKRGKNFYFGSYPQGALLEWNPLQKQKNKQSGSITTPYLLASSIMYTHRPHRILAFPDNKTVIMSGTPEYGYTGGGLLFWDNVSKTSVVLNDSMVVCNQSTMSMVALPDGKMLGGTTTQPGTGGEKKAKQAELYLMDIKSRKVEWHEPFLEGVQDYSDLQYGKNGLVYGIANLRIFFVFDPRLKKIIHQENLEPTFGRTSWAQSPRIFVEGENGDIYILFVKGIVKLDPKTFKLTMIATSPVPVDIGGDYHDGKIYFASGSHLCSYKIK